MTAKTSAARAGGAIEFDATPYRQLVRDDRSLRIVHLYGMDAEREWAKACREQSLEFGYAPTQPGRLG